MPEISGSNVSGPTAGERGDVEGDQVAEEQASTRAKSGPPPRGDQRDAERDDEEHQVDEVHRRRVVPQRFGDAAQMSANAPSRPSPRPA